MSAAEGVACTACGQVYSVSSRFWYTCPNCGGILEVRYALNHVSRPPWSNECNGIWRFESLLPPVPKTQRISLGEGNTPLVRCSTLEKQLGVNSVWCKVEATNPTGSFKDRLLALLVSQARSCGATTVITASSGNAGTSMGAYAARATLRAVAVVPEGTSGPRVSQMLAYGVQVVQIKGHVAQAYDVVQWISRQIPGWINVGSTFLTPYAVEASKTIAYEVFEQLGGQVPSWVVVPVAAGPILVGILKGFEELRALGLTSGLPRMVAVQAEGCAPIARAFSTAAREVIPWGKPTTLVQSIADPLEGYPQDGTHTLNAIRRSNGIAVAIPDAAIQEAACLLAKDEGIFAELAAAAPIAALRWLRDHDVVARKETVVCVVTGHGAKDEFWGRVPMGPVVDASPRAVLEFLREVSLAGTAAPEGDAAASQSKG